ncbi:NAD-dependent epimerase/dehydratase family protein [Streptomyces avermitilis]|uniref:NAD-dependent epimerase/dehydratase family protein n=1 Tax=Streptomyces avermitilis TaxID=33903 RepID=UPI00339E776E
MSRLVLLDRVPLQVEAANEVVHIVDLRDAAAVETALVGANAVLHLGGLPDEAPLEHLLDANVLGTHHVLEAARRAAIPRVVLASSNRVSGFYPTAHRTGPQEPVRPDGLYGVGMAAIEALGRLYADKFDVSVICLRIGSFEEAPTESRHLATWLSPRDAVGFCRAALRTGIRMRCLGSRMTACQFTLARPGGLWKLDSGPVIDFALSVGIVACGHDCAVGTQAKGVR